MLRSMPCASSGYGLPVSGIRSLLGMPDRGMGTQEKVAVAVAAKAKTAAYEGWL